MGSKYRQQQTATSSKEVVVDEVESAELDAVVDAVDEPVQEVSVVEPEAVFEEVVVQEEPTPEPVLDAPVKQPVDTDARPADVKAFAASLSDYVARLAPNKVITNDELTKAQMALIAICDTLLRKKDQSFIMCCKEMIQVVTANRKGVFSEYNVFRKFPELRVPPETRKRAESIITLFMVASDVKNPRNIGQHYDLNQLFRYIRDDETQQLFQSYFGS